MKPLSSKLWAALVGLVVTTVASAQLSHAAPKVPKEIKAMIDEKACLTCHQVGNLGDGKLAPNLRYVGERRSKKWLKKWLADPLSVKNPTIMPGGLLDEAQIDAMAGFLAGLKNRTNTKAILEEHKSDPVAAGKALFAAHDCGTCHKIDGAGGNFSNTGPDLKGVSSRRKPAWVKKWLKNPQKIKKGTFMPTFKLSAAEIEALSAFLATL